MADSPKYGRVEPLSSKRSSSARAYTAAGQNISRNGTAACESGKGSIAFSSEVDSGSLEENATKQKLRAFSMNINSMKML
jgi:hypothetical protein